MAERIKILHFISNLNRGGAEAMLQKVIYATAGLNVESTVISMMSGGPIADELRRAGISVHEFGMRSGFAAISKLRSFRALVHDLKPDLLQGWMYHANIAASISAAGIFGPGIPVVWNVRQSLPTLRNESLMTALAIIASAPLSYLPRAIIYNSFRAAEDHERILYFGVRRMIIPNGFDTALFIPNPSTRNNLILQLNLPADAQIVGRIANFHKHKDFKTLFDAFSIISKENLRAHLVLIGRGLTSSNSEFASLMASLPSADRVHIMGERSDVASIMPGFDVLVSSSSAEAFPNVIGEAMASGVPTVTTDAGDCRNILEDSARVVSCHDAEMLASRTLAILSLDPVERVAIGIRDRERIVSHYSLEAVAKLYVDLWRREISAT